MKTDCSLHTGDVVRTKLPIDVLRPSRRRVRVPCGTEGEVVREPRENFSMVWVKFRGFRDAFEFDQEDVELVREAPGARS
jgi:hypothetical protein